MAAFSMLFSNLYHSVSDRDAIPAHHRFVNFHGQHGARLNSDQTVHGRKHQRSLLIQLLSPLLFSAPDVHLKSLESILVDRIVRLGSWNRFIGKLNSEWSEFTL